MGSDPRGRPYLLAYGTEDTGELHAYEISDGGTTTYALCGHTRYFSDRDGKVRHTDEDKPDELCDECRETMEQEPPIGTRAHKEWLRERGHHV